MVENKVLKYEIGNIRKEKKTKLDQLEQEKEDLNVKVKEIIFELKK